MRNLALATLLCALFTSESFAVVTKKSQKEPIERESAAQVTQFEIYEPGSVTRARGTIRVRSLGETFNFRKARLSVPEQKSKEIQIDAKK
jgi:hypothetical protein